MGFYADHILPRLINLAMRNEQLAPYRKRVLALAQGRVLEVGMGSGQNLPFYTNRADSVVGIEPHPKLLATASTRASVIPSTLIEASAESLPLEDASIDTVVATWTLCSIPDVTAALAEIHRVLKPDGQFLFVEHGLAQDERVRRWQHRMTPVWKRLAGGCHLDRPVAALLQNAGFEVTHLDTGYMKGPKPMTFMYEGSARPV
jgi:ubiquinone/menaquinone biosynthesis C-methylase UbiE